MAVTHYNDPKVLAEGFFSFSFVCFDQTSFNLFIISMFLFYLNAFLFQFYYLIYLFLLINHLVSEDLGEAMVGLNTEQIVQKWSTKEKN